jgi:hypothetical protein
MVVLIEDVDGAASALGGGVPATASLGRGEPSMALCISAML